MLFKGSLHLTCPPPPLPPSSSGGTLYADINSPADGQVCPGEFSGFSSGKSHILGIPRKPEQFVILWVYKNKTICLLLCRLVYNKAVTGGTDVAFKSQAYRSEHLLLGLAKLEKPRHSSGGRRMEISSRYMLKFSTMTYIGLSPFGATRITPPVSHIILFLLLNVWYKWVLLLVSILSPQNCPTPSISVHM